jgi:hypothetical protein
VSHAIAGTTEKAKANVLPALRCLEWKRQIACRASPSPPPPHAAAVANYCDHVEHNEDVAMKFTIELDIRALLPCAGGSAACGDRERSA